MSSHQSDRLQIPRSFALAASAVLTPIAYVSYVLVVRRLQGTPLTVEVEQLFSAGMLLYVLVLAVTGILATLDWYWGLRVTPPLTVGGLLFWPWIYFFSAIGNVGYASVPFVGVLVVTLIEGAIRFPERIERVFTGSVGRYALVAGLLHFVLGFGLQLYARQGLPGGVLIVLAYAVSALGLVATGAVPVLLWSRYRMVSPVVATTGWFLWGLYGTWTIRNSLPRGAFSGINWDGLPPYPDYMLKWTLLMIALLVLAGAELMVRRVGRTIITGESSSLD